MAHSSIVFVPAIQGESVSHSSLDRCLENLQPDNTALEESIRTPVPHLYVRACAVREAVAPETL